MEHQSVNAPSANAFWGKGFPLIVENSKPRPQKDSWKTFPYALNVTSELQAWSIITNSPCCCSQWPDRVQQPPILHIRAEMNRIRSSVRLPSLSSPCTVILSVLRCRSHGHTVHILLFVMWLSKKLIYSCQSIDLLKEGNYCAPAHGK